MEYEQAKELLVEFDGDLYWRKTVNGRAQSGDRAGSINNHGYRMIRYNRKDYPAHRLAWLLYYGSMPDGSVDHIDHNRRNNRIENLRIVTNAENAKNVSRSVANKSGVTGVNWDKAKNRWRAQIMMDGKKKNLGAFIRKSDAIMARKQAEIGAGFHPNHGKAI